MRRQTRDETAVVNRSFGVARPWLALSSGDITYRGFMALYWIILARFLVPQHLGFIALANSISVPLFVVLDAGFQQYLVREYRVGDIAGLPRPLRSAVVRRYLLGVPAAGAVGLITYSLTGRALAGQVGAAIGLSYAFDWYSQMWLAPARARIRFAPDFTVRVMQSFGVVLGVSIAVFLLRPSVLEIALISTIIYAVAALPALSQWLAYPRWQSAAPERDKGREDRWTFAAATILIALYTRADALAVQVSLGSSTLAVYAVASRLIEAGRIAPWAIGRVVLASSSQEGDSTRLIDQAHLESGAIVGAAAAGGVFSGGPWMVAQLFGQHYGSAGAGVLRTLAPTLLVIGFTSPLTSHFMAIGEGRFVVRTAAVTLSATAVALWLLVPVLGLEGAALSVLSAESISALLIATRAKPMWRMLHSRHFVATLIVAIGLSSLSLLFKSVSVPSFVLGAVIAATGAFMAWTQVRRHG
jgi:O-antigen/teichoic acid export membrane protein